MSTERFVVSFVEIFVFGFSILYALCNSALIWIGFGPARGRVRSLAHSDLDLMGTVEACPPVAVLVPAYNEEVGIVEAVRAFLELDYPALEVVVANDGSKDATLAVLRKAFSLKRRDVTLRGDLDTAPVRGIYEATTGLPDNVLRLVVVDKENGGRADALNCAINACRAPYFVTVDGDSILDPLALKHLMRIIQDDPSVQAAGGQIGIVNECPVKGGRVLERVIPRSYLALCQTIEYVRSFTTARSGFSRLGCLMILSGAFLLIRRDLAMTLGGFLTGRVRSKLLDEYAGPGCGTIGEDMELITRLHRYERENGRKARVVHSPLPVCWTEVPSSWTTLGRQRRRWHRGFLEILRYHGKMLFDPSYGRVGLFSFPFLALFEGLGPYLEAAGLLLLPVLAILGWIDVGRAVLLAAVMLGVGVVHSMVAVLCATWLEPVVPAGSRVRSVLGVDCWRDRLLLLAACIIAELGYRQATVWWRLHGTWEYMRGTQSWGAMERKGFRGATNTACLVVGLLGAASRVAAEDRFAAPPNEASLMVVQEIQFVGGSDRREDGSVSDWFESFAKWDRRDARAGRGMWIGGFGRRRGTRDEAGLLFGVSAMRPRRFGGAIELRAAPGATTLARTSWRAEGEAALRPRFGATASLRESSFADARVVEAAPGFILYAPHDVDLALRATWARTSFDEGPADDVFGWGAAVHVPWRFLDARVHASSGSESYLAGSSLEPGRVRSRSLGLTLRAPIEGSWGFETGFAVRSPDRGSDEVTVHAGARRRW